MQVRLVVERGAKGKALPLPDGVTTMGRSRRCIVRIPVAHVSRLHCRLHRTTTGVVIIEDLQSANGTRLNGRRIAGAHVVRPGDRLKIGPVTFVVEYELTPAALEALRTAEQQRPRLDQSESLPEPHSSRPARTEKKP